MSDQDLSKIKGYNEPKYAQMAEKNTILRAVHGSTAHGLGSPGDADRDEMGVCIESFEAFAGFSEFEQYIFRSAAAREGRQDAPSQDGDLDLVIYSLKKYLRLAMQGNPSVLNLLYAADPIKCNEFGYQLKNLAPYIISRQAGKRYLGYMESQRMRLLGERGQKKTNRPELEEAHGYDTKYAMHIVRLGYQGVELLTQGYITMPMVEPVRKEIYDIRTGKVSLQKVLTWAGDLERELKDLIDSSELPEHPDKKLIEEWMLETYMLNWENQPLYHPADYGVQGDLNV